MEVAKSINLSRIFTKNTFSIRNMVTIRVQFSAKLWMKPFYNLNPIHTSGYTQCLIVFHEASNKWIVQDEQTISEHEVFATLKYEERHLVNLSGSLVEML